MQNHRDICQPKEPVDGKKEVESKKNYKISGVFICELVLNLSALSLFDDIQRNPHPCLLIILLYQWTDNFYLKKISNYMIDYPYSFFSDKV